MELSIVGTNISNIPIPEPPRGTGRPGNRTGGKPAFKDTKKQVMTMDVAPVKGPIAKGKVPANGQSPAEIPRIERQRPTLEERQNKKYDFPDEDVAEIFDYLMFSKMIELPQSKRPQEVNLVDNPKFCKYHRVLGHPIEKCFIFKEKVMELVRDNKIDLGAYIPPSNMISVANNDTSNTIFGAVYPAKIIGLPSLGDNATI
ncbi:hypothetical protein MLD38_025601 [Melastoma candidum]|uniref:Uncharacterized protein n=1 Tax=Melastoma candidum TaxID=119954 RepID=A0ACB9NVY2_9MYRT|nr:hypothetical protein MLD38_025601 [Melastoma candidum]